MVADNTQESALVRNLIEANSRDRSPSNLLGPEVYVDFKRNDGKRVQGWYPASWAHESGWIPIEVYESIMGDIR
jgi:hypothetical protein